MMHEREKSDPAIVAVKPTNKAERSAAEPVERRAGANGNADQHNTCRAQYRVSVSQALERIRQVRRHSLEVGAVCGKAARTVLCGGRSAMGVPTAIVASLLAMTGAHLNLPLRPQRLQHQVDHVFAAGTPRGCAGQVLAEDGRQGGRVREEEVAEACDRNIEVHRIDTLAKSSGPYAVGQDLRD